jgi:hypothetical protein
MKTKFILLFLLIAQAGFSQKIDNTLTKQEQKKGWILLFDGKTFNGWTTSGGKPVSKGWAIENGSLSTTKNERGGDIVSEQEYGNFIFTVDYKIEPGCNSGIKYFFTKYQQGGNLGLEYQILDDKLAEDNQKANHLCGSLYDILPPNEKIKKVNAPGQWNTIKIVSKNNQVEHWLNGKMILKFTRGNKAFTDAVALSKFNKVVPAFGTVEKGKLLLQEHGGLVAFKNIKVLPL